MAAFRFPPSPADSPTLPGRHRATSKSGWKTVSSTSCVWRWEGAQLTPGEIHQATNDASRKAPVIGWRRYVRRIDLSVWTYPSLRKLWLGTTISLLGSQFTGLAI